MTAKPVTSLAEAFALARNKQDVAPPLARYQERPIEFCIEVLGIPRSTLVWSANAGYDRHQWDGTHDPLVALANALKDGKDVGVESGTGTGKSYLVACLIYWFLASWRKSLVFTFATKEDQLRLFVWKEMRELFPKFQRHFPNATLTDLCLRVLGGQDDSWAAHGYAVGVRSGETVASRAKGMHAEDMFLIYEEAQGIDPAVTEAGLHTVTGHHNLRAFIGNPDNQQDALHRACLSPGVEHIRVSALDHPNVVTGQTIVPGGAVSKKSVDRRRALYGEEHRLFLTQIRGISPAESSEALIRLEWVTKSNERWKECQKNGTLEKWGKPAYGIDVANSEAGDKAAWAFGKGRVLLTIEDFPCPNANDLGFRVAKRMDADKVEAAHVGVDAVGVGAGTVNELARLQKYVRSLQGGPVFDYGSEEDFNTLRSQMQWRMREDLRMGLVDLPPDPELAQDLITAEYETRNSKIIVQSKEKIKEDLGRSPNKGDAVVYWNFVRDRSPVAEPIQTGITVRHGDPVVTKRPVYDTNSIHGDDDPRGAEIPGAMSSRMGKGW